MKKTKAPAKKMTKKAAKKVSPAKKAVALDLTVRIFAHKGMLGIEALKPEETDKFKPAGKGRIGCVLRDTDKALGISDEALALLKTVKRSHDDIGDVDAFVTDNGEGVFCWLGGLKSMKDPKSSDGSRTYDMDKIKFVTIPNDVPKEFKDAVG